MSTIVKKLRNLTDYRCTKEESTRKKIVVEYMPLVRYIAGKIAARLPANVEVDDLVSCGVIGLMDAIKKFDSSRDNKFKTYAEFRIRGSILDELRSQDWIPRSIREKAKLIERTHQKLEKKLGRKANHQEMCNELKMTHDEYFQLLDQAKSASVVNLDDVVTLKSNDKKQYTELLEKRKFSNPFANVNQRGSQERIRQCIKKLPEKQRLVLSLYYYEDLNLKEIGQVLDVSESRVSQLHGQAVVELKRSLEGEFQHYEDLAA